MAASGFQKRMHILRSSLLNQKKILAYITVNLARRESYWIRFILLFSKGLFIFSTFPKFSEKLTFLTL